MKEHQSRQTRVNLTLARYLVCFRSVSEFNEFKLSLKSPKNLFQLSAG